MGYKAVQNESAHLTDKPGRSAFGPKKHRKKSATETPASKGGDKYKKSRPGKTNS